MNASHDHGGHRCCHAAHGAVPDGSASAPSRLIDPVCGMTVEPDSPHRASHGGTEYRFCSAGCRTKFVADPAMYLAAAAAEPVSVTAGTQYTCPMSPRDSSRRSGDLSALRHGARARDAQP